MPLKLIKAECVPNQSAYRRHVPTYYVSDLHTFFKLFNTFIYSGTYFTDVLSKSDTVFVDKKVPVSKQALKESSKAIGYTLTTDSKKANVIAVTSKDLVNFLREVNVATGHDTLPLLEAKYNFLHYCALDRDLRYCHSTSVLTDFSDPSNFQDLFTNTFYQQKFRKLVELNFPSYIAVSTDSNEDVTYVDVQLQYENHAFLDLENRKWITGVIFTKDAEKPQTPIFHTIIDNCDRIINGEVKFLITNMNLISSGLVVENKSLTPTPEILDGIFNNIISSDATVAGLGLKMLENLPSTLETALLFAIAYKHNEDLRLTDHLKAGVQLKEIKNILKKYKINWHGDRSTFIRSLIYVKSALQEDGIDIFNHKYLKILLNKVIDEYFFGHFGMSKEVLNMFDLIKRVK
jgi:hypothetical protein